MVQRSLLNLLRLLIIRAQARKAQGPIFSLGFLLGPKPERRRALLFSLGFLFIYKNIFLLSRHFWGAPWKTIRKLDVQLTHTCTY